MTNSYFKISLDIQDHGSNVSLKVKKGDTGRLLYITLMDGRNPYVITKDCYVVFTAKKADGNILYNKCSIIGNTITYEFTPQTTSAVGKAECEIKLYGSEDKLLTSARFTIIVEDTVYNEGDEVESEKEVSALTDLVSKASNLIASGLKGEKGDKGDSGVVAPANGFYAMMVDRSTGDLYCVTEEDTTSPTFSLDESGNLYYEIKEV